MADTPLTDDYVASILQRDASKNSQNRYLSNSGLGSLLSGGGRSRANAPKPNTRFLRNIVRDADSHNAALKRKEEEESRVRLRELKSAKDRDEKYEERKANRRRSQERYDVRHRKEGLSSREKDLKKSRHRSRSRERHREHRRSRSPERESQRSRQHRDDRSPGRESRRSIRRERDERSSHRKAHKSKPDRDEKSPNTDRGPDRTSKNDPLPDENSDSDPLESIIGPKPPPTTLPRGRGALKSSTMNSRFDPSYDPKADVALDPDEEGDDWDMALEALKDRAKWRQSGAERLRAAGFTEDEVANWERGGGGRRGDAEKDISDVRWANKGEGREWDRGKVVDEDEGTVDVEASWGRLKDT